MPKLGAPGLIRHRGFADAAESATRSDRGVVGHTSVPRAPPADDCAAACVATTLFQYLLEYWITVDSAKDRLYAGWADIARALASPKRLELLDVLAQGERPVEALARETGLTVNNTSSHLAVLKGARLVETRKEAQFVFHRLTDDRIIPVLRGVQELARRRQLEVDRLARAYIDDRDALEPIGAPELRRRLKAGDVTLVDVRPAVEFAAAHIAGAISVPVAELERRLESIPRRRLVVAYCRGPYCVLSVQAVEKLRRHGYRAVRLREGLPDWKAAQLPVKTGA
jgi:rhodanese-related sulfurtransferase